MSLVKRELEEREAAWDRKARAEHLLCSVCSQHITYADREVFFRSKMRTEFSMGVACWPVYQMLFGMAFELILKAIVVAKNELPDHSHDLNDLAHKTCVEFSKEELDILKVLTESIVWDGRYPVPKKKEYLEKHYKHAHNVIHGSGKRKRITLKWEDLDRIWKKSQQQFFTLYKT